MNLRAFSRHPSRRTLMALHDGEIHDGARAAALRSHAQECPRCGQWLDGLERVGALARGEATAGVSVVASDASPRRVALPPASRLLPALAAVAAVVVGLVATEQPERPSEQVAAEGERPDDSPVASGGSPTPTTVAGRPAEGAAAPGTTVPADASSPRGETPGGGVAASQPDPPVPVVLGLLVPAGDPAARDVVAAVEAAVEAANAAGGVAGRELRVVVDDASDPDAPRRLEAAGAVALVGGYGAPAAVFSTTASLGVPWFAPVDGVEATTGVVPVEIPHRQAGTLLAHAARASGADRAVAVTSAVPERQLADGVADVLDVASVKLGSASCVERLEQAAAPGIDLIVLALDPPAVAQCLASLPRTFPVRRILVPVTAVDEARRHAPDGFSVGAVAGLPLPDDGDDAGARRFRKAVAGSASYRALVSFAGTELALHAIRRDLTDPYRGFLRAGRYTSDLVSLDPGADPPNASARIVELGSELPKPGADANG